MKLESNYITVLLADIGWKDYLAFSLPRKYWKNAEEGRAEGVEVVTKEELERFRIELQSITQN